MTVMGNILLLPYPQSKGDAPPAGWLMCPQLKIQTQRHPVLRRPNRGGTDPILGVWTQTIGRLQIQQSGSAKPLLVESLQPRLKATIHILLVLIDTPPQRQGGRRKKKLRRTRLALPQNVMSTFLSPNNPRANIALVISSTVSSKPVLYTRLPNSTTSLEGPGCQRLRRNCPRQTTVRSLKTSNNGLLQ